jgi:hypothetical protein
MNNKLHQLVQHYVWWSFLVILGGLEVCWISSQSKPLQIAMQNKADIYVSNIE